MKNKKILVLVKFFKGEINPFDASSLECALNIENAEVIALSMSPLVNLEQMKSLTRLNVKCIMLSDKVYAGADTLATSYALSKAIERINPDVIFCGRQSVDGDTSQVPPQLAERLNLKLISRVMSVKDGQITTRSGEKFVLEENQILSFEKSYSLRFPSMFSKLGEVEIIDNSTLNLDERLCGQKGSPTKVIRSYESTLGRRQCTFTTQNEIESLIKEKQNKTLNEGEITKEKLEVVHFIGRAKSVAQSIGKKVVEIEVDGKDADEVSKEILSLNAKVVLFSDEDKIKELASRIAVKLNAGLCADCTSLRIENGEFVMTRPALGGNVTADIISSSEIKLATVRTSNPKCAEIVFGVGRGATHVLDKITELAQKYNAEICCSRVVADSGILPYEKQVGLTGKTISPKIYVAFGISGAVQHTCAIERAQTIIAINCDKDARIFDYADFGIVKKL